jgi:hypothetical protein
MSEGQRKRVLTTAPNRFIHRQNPELIARVKAIKQANEAEGVRIS